MIVSFHLIVFLVSEYFTPEWQRNVRFRLFKAFRLRLPVAQSPWLQLKPVSFGIPKRHHSSPPPFSRALKVFGFFWLCSTGPFLPRPILLCLGPAILRLLSSLPLPKTSLVLLIAILAARNPGPKAAKLLKILSESSSFSNATTTGCEIF